MVLKELAKWKRERRILSICLDCLFLIIDIATFFWLLGVLSRVKQNSDLNSKNWAGMEAINSLINSNVEVRNSNGNYFACGCKEFCLSRTSDPHIYQLFDFNLNYISELVGEGWFDPFLCCEMNLNDLSQYNSTSESGLEQLTPFVVTSGLIFIPFEVIGYLSKIFYIFQFSRLPVEKNIKYTRFFVLMDALVVSCYVLGFIHVFDFSSKALGISFLVFVYIGNFIGMGIAYRVWRDSKMGDVEAQSTNVSFLLDHFFDSSGLFFEIIMFLHLILWCRSSLVLGMKIVTRSLSIFWTHLSLVRSQSNQYTQL